MKLNPFANSNPMSWKDAFKVALILTGGKFFTVFMLLWGYTQVMADPSKFLYDALIFFFGALFTDFMVLAGLTEYVKKTSEKKSETNDTNE